MLYYLFPVLILSSGCELNLIRSFEKQQEILNILHSEYTDHYSRLWLVGFLKWVGYSLEQICDIIDKEASWSGYDAKITYNQVSSVFNRPGRPGNTHKGISSPSCTWFNRVEWEKRYGKRFCTLHYVSCKDCPDNAGPGQACKGRV